MKIQSTKATTILAFAAVMLLAASWVVHKTGNDLAAESALQVEEARQDAHRRNYLFAITTDPHCVAEVLSVDPGEVAGTYDFRGDLGARDGDMETIRERCVLKDGWPDARLRSILMMSAALNGVPGPMDRCLRYPDWQTRCSYSNDARRGCPDRTYVEVELVSPTGEVFSVSVVSGDAATVDTGMGTTTIQLTVSEDGCTKLMKRREIPPVTVRSTDHRGQAATSIIGAGGPSHFTASGIEVMLRDVRIRESQAGSRGGVIGKMQEMARNDRGRLLERCGNDWRPKCDDLLQGDQ